MDMTQKIDVLDLLINVLKDHEKDLDEKIHKLDKLITRLEGKDITATLLKRYYEPIG